jgi:hypothetical protein
VAFGFILRSILEVEITRLIVFTLTAGFGWSIIAYAGYANTRGWPVGAWLAGDFSWLQGLAYLALVGAVAAAAYSGAWWHAIIVVVAANLVVRVLFPMAGPQAQVVSTLGVVIGIPLSVVLLWL